MFTGCCGPEVVRCDTAGVTVAETLWRAIAWGGHHTRNGTTTILLDFSLVRDASLCMHSFAGMRGSEQLQQVRPAANLLWLHGSLPLLIESCRCADCGGPISSGLHSWLSAGVAGHTQGYRLSPPAYKFQRCPPPFYHVGLFCPRSAPRLLQTACVQACRASRSHLRIQKYRQLPLDLLTMQSESTAARAWCVLLLACLNRRLQCHWQALPMLIAKPCCRLAFLLSLLWKQ